VETTAGQPNISLLYVRPALIGVLIFNDEVIVAVRETFRVEMAVDDPQIHEGQLYTVRLFGENMQNIRKASSYIGNLLQDEALALTGQFPIRKPKPKN